MKTLIILNMLFTPLTGMTTGFELKNQTVIDAIIKAADRVEIPRELLLAICFEESSFRTKGVTHIDGGSISHSICQVKLSSAKFMDQYYHHKYTATPDRLEDLFINAFYAGKLIKYQLQRYNDNWKLAIDAYNKGTAYSEKTKYVKKVTKHLSFIKQNVLKATIYAK